jgi:Flp pilus assembly protein TadD
VTERSWAGAHHPRRTRSTAGGLLLALLAVALPLARGGVDLWVEVAGAALALVAFALATADEPRLPWPMLLLLGVLGVSVLQLVPVPAALHAISPGARRIFDVSLAPLGLYPAARPFSLDPAASARELAKAIACTAAFGAAWTHADGRRRRERLLLGLAGSGMAVATVVLGAALLGMGPLLVPHFPFFNPNHLAGFLNLTAFVALGLALRSHGQARALWLMGFAAAGAVSFLSLSRGGIAAFLLGAAIYVALHVRARRSELSGPSPLGHGLLAGGLAAALGIAAYLALQPILGELRTLRSAPEDAKLQLFRPALEVIRDFPLTGVGRGAFGAVFTAYQSESASVTFMHVENEVIQALADLGIPAGVLLVGTFVLVWLAAARRRDLPSVEMGLLAGTGALAAQNAVDFSLGLLGAALPFAIAMGLLARGQRPVVLRRPVLLGGLGLALAAVAGAALVARAHGGEADPARVARAGDAVATAEAARGAARWHPADWVPHATAGARLAGEGRCAEALPWLLRAMSLDPSAPQPHLSTARCLAGRNDPAAKREYRLAITFGSPALAEAAARYASIEDLLDVAPETPDGLLALGDVLAAGRPRDAEVAYRRVLEDFADDRALLPLARSRAALGDPEGALELARRHSATRPADPAGWSIAASALLQLGREDEARGEIERGLAAIPGSPALVTFLAERAMAARRFSEAHRLADEIAPRTPGEIAGKHLLVARALAGQGRLSEALDRARSAAAAVPDSPGLLAVVADYATQAGRFDDAVAALRQAAALPGVPPGTYDQRIAGLEAAKAEQVQRLLERRALQGVGEGGKR